MPEDNEMPEGIMNALQEAINGNSVSSEHHAGHMIELLSRAASSLLNHAQREDVSTTVQGILKVIDIYTSGFEKPQAE